MIMDPSLVRYCRNTTLISFHFTANYACERIKKKATERNMGPKLFTMLFLLKTHIFPWNTLWTSCVLDKTISEPRVALQVFFQEIHILLLHFSGGNRWKRFLKNSLKLTLRLIMFLISRSVIPWFRKACVISVVKLGWHVCSLL